MSEQADHRAALLQPAHRAVFPQNDGRQVTTVAVSEFALVAIVDAQKQRGVFLRRGALVELMIEQ